MTVPEELPLWAALLTAILVLVGAAVTLIGSLGLLRLGTFYARVHAPTLGTTFGMACILAGSALCFSMLEARPVVHEILIAVFVTLTTPVTLMLLVRAALYRDRTEGSRDVPAAEAAEDLAPPG
jgi:multicomponent K+:H+ antiporter subunit G